MTHSIENRGCLGDDRQHVQVRRALNWFASSDGFAFPYLTE